MTQYDYDLFVIGGGSGGVRASRMAALAGARVALAEEWRMGGTCVIRGCIPKKLLVYASQFRENILDSAGYANAPMTLRQRDGGIFKTDSGNVIYDCAFGAIQNASKLAAAISAVPGVVEHGLFIGMATTLLIAADGEIEVIQR